MSKSTNLDEIGPWSQIKLEIVKEYAAAYSTILTSKGFHHVYIDGFAGSGKHVSKSTGKYVKGSPLVALTIDPPFKHYYFIELKEQKAERLSDLVHDRQDVSVFAGDCNTVLLNKVFPNVRWSDYKRGLCLLDPYGIHLNWEVLETAGGMKSIDVLLNFSVLDINRNLVRDDPATIKDSEVDRMNRFWGDQSWYDYLYGEDPDLFVGNRERRFAKANQVLPRKFRERLKKIAGFKFVPDPIPMKNSTGAILYYVFFASHNSVAGRIARDIFRKWTNR